MTAYTIRETTADDGAAVWSLVRRAGTLDLNTPYCYLLLCDAFRGTCRVAESDGRIVGFVSALIRPDRPDTLFFWQIAVEPAMRGQGLGLALLRDAFRGAAGRVHFVEATVSPSNRASGKLFEAFARELEAVLVRGDGGYRADDFPTETEHEEEPLLRIGPIRA